MPFAVNLPTYIRLTRPVRCYSCVACTHEDRAGNPAQRTVIHVDTEFAFQHHMHRQAKHSFSERHPTPNEVLARIAAE